MAGKQCMLLDSEQIWLEERVMGRQVWKSKAKKGVQQENKRLSCFVCFFTLFTQATLRQIQATLKE